MVFSSPEETDLSVIISWLLFGLPVINTDTDIRWAVYTDQRINKYS